VRPRLSTTRRDARNIIGNPYDDKERCVSTIYLLLYVLLGAGNPTPASDAVNVAATSSVSGDTFKSPF
jgi:hypothetical protein